MADYISYANQGAIRNQPISPELAAAFGFLPEMGLGMEVFSGGEIPGKTASNSGRHLHGNAADVFFTRDGQRLDWANPEQTPIFQDIVSRAKSAGVTGFGAGQGYMQPGSMHVGYGAPAIWGAGGKGVNASDWLRTAYGAAPAAQSQGQFSTQGAAPMARAQQPAGLLPMPQAPEQAGILGGILGDKVNGYLTPDRLARLQIGLEGMTLNPNVAMMAAARDGIQGREQDRQAQRKEGERVGQVNKTIEWLNSQGMGDLANAVATGVLPIGQAFNAAQQAQQGPARDLKVINGQVVDMGTMQPVGDFRTPDDNSTTLIKNIEYFTALGYSPEESARLAKSGQNIDIHTGDTGPKLIGTEGDYLDQDEAGRWVVKQAPGSEAARRESEAASKAKTDAAETAAREGKADRNEQVRSTVVSTGVDTLIGMIDKDAGILDLPETGIIGGALAGLGVNQEAVDFKNTLSSLQANVAFDALQKMREASKTGGALGAVSERELTLLISTLGALEQSSSPELMRQNLLTIKDIMGKIERDPVASAAYHGGAAPGAGDGFSITGTVD